METQHSGHRGQRFQQESLVHTAGSGAACVQGQPLPDFPIVTLLFKIFPKTGFLKYSSSWRRFIFWNLHLCDIKINPELLSNYNISLKLLMWDKAHEFLYYILESRSPRISEPLYHSLLLLSKFSYCNICEIQVPTERRKKKKSKRAEMTSANYSFGEQGWKGTLGKFYLCERQVKDLQGYNLL